jgi:hypothetical protein
MKAGCAMRKKAVAGLLLGILIAGCATRMASQYTREGVEYGKTRGVFRGRWWSYYERGASFLGGGFYGEAVRDFQQALDGRSRDSWRARTYGLHFVEYFPNRELGIALFEQGNYGEAEEYLKKSLEEIDTERAHLYLDRIKKKKIAAGEIKDEEAPAVGFNVKPDLLARLELESEKPLPPPEEPEEKPAETAVAEKPETKPVKPEAVAKPAAETLKANPVPAGEETEPVETEKGLIVRERTMKVAVGANDDVGVEEVRVNGKQMYQRGSAEKVAFEEDVTLAEGEQEIEVAAKDLAAKEVKENIRITVDLTGPTIGVFSPIEPTVTEEGTVLLEGATVDKYGVKTVAVGERLIAESEGDPRLDFDTELPLTDGENTFVLAARDIAGNENRAAVHVFRGDPDSFEAKLFILKHKYPERLMLAAGGPLTLEVLDSLLTAVPEPTGEIRVKSPREGEPYRHNRTLRVAGEVVTQTKVASLSINGEPFEDLVGAAKEVFNRRIPLDPGKIDESGESIQVAIRAEDENGSVMEKNLEVKLRPVALNSKESRMPVAVLAFAGQGVAPEVAEKLRLATESQLLKQDRFRVLDRTRLQEVLTEQQLSSALGSPDEALSLGRLTAANVFLVADVFLREEKGLEIKARVVDTETSDLVNTLDVYIEDGGNADFVTQKCGDLAVQLSRLYPRLSGQVLSVRGDTDMLVNWTVEDGVREGAYLLLLHEEEPWVDEDTGEVLAPGEYVPVGRARIENVLKSGVKATAVQEKEEEKEGVKLEKGMPAITM